jgi:hypothetical protein
MFAPDEVVTLTHKVEAGRLGGCEGTITPENAKMIFIRINNYNVMRVIGNSLKFHLVIVISFLTLFSCDEFNFTKKNTNKIVVFNVKDKWQLNITSFNGNESIGVCGNGDFVFKVSKWLLDDTLYLSYTYIPENDTVHHYLESRLYLDKSVTCEQIEKFFNINNIYNHSLNEKLYWLCKLTSAKLIEHKNFYGDVTEYYVMAGDKIVPPKYYEIRKLRDGFNNDQSLKIFPKNNLLVEKGFQGNSIEFSLLLEHPSDNKNPFLGYDLLSDDVITYSTTKISMENSDFQVRPAKGYNVRLKIIVRSFFGISKGRDKNEYDYSYYPQFFPYNFREIEK